MPSYYFMFVSLAVHAAVLGLAAPYGWFGNASATARPYLHAKIVPPQYELVIQPPPARGPRSIQPRSAQPAWRHSEIKRPAAAPRAVVAAAPVPRWTPMASVGFSVGAPAPAPVAATGPAEEPVANAPSGEGGGPSVAPSYSFTPLPPYPRVAKQRGLEGVAVVRIEVLEDGHVGKVELVQSSGHNVLDQSAVQAVHDWRFQPARRGERTVAAFIEVPIRFKLEDRGA